MIALDLLTSRRPKVVRSRASAAAGVVAAALGGAAGPAWAGPPYVTDDPEPTALGRWENYAYVQGTGVPGGVVGQAGLQINYGGAPNLQLGANLPIAFDGGPGGGAGPGDIQLSAKYRFVRQDGHGWTPDIAIFPDLGIPTGAPGLGTGHVTVSLPIWVQKDFGKWSTFGGASYTLNPGGANRDYSLFGWAVTRDVTANLNIGMEIWRQTSPTSGGKPFTALSLGAIWRLSPHLALVASGGPGLENPRADGRGVFFAALEFNY